ncbi:superoxide dismutase family protein [Rickettsiales bacterium]|nr:superoxide dismutase family protein [Rickettsiales bacterium]MDA7705353.1 superoxide dismutase family protein [Rickettsiales bacterium]MDB2550390.1 superoxide dismutase family protein [Rickettsiales bacterium]
MKKYLLLLLLLFCTSCIQGKYQKAIAKMEPVKGSKISGIIYLKQEKNGVLLEAEFENLNRKLHAFHIHANGDVTKNDGSGTGAHYYGKGYDEGDQIIGNLGNVKRISKNSKYQDFLENLTIDEIAGRSMVIHAKMGSKKYSKFINSGKRIATGVIGIIE